MRFASPFPSDVRTIGVFAPAGVPDPERLERGLERLQQWGLQIVFPGRDDPRDRFFAGSDALRLQRLHELLADPTVDVLLAARGGYGCARLLDGIDWDLFLSRNLPLIGYSDLTALHVAAFAHGYRRGIFGPMVAGDFARVPADAVEEAELAGVYSLLGATLCGQQRTHGKLRCLRSGEASGALVPANLAVLASLAGTRHFPDLTGAILVLEDINEAAYRIDRCLHQLSQSGLLDGLAGLVFAQFSQTEDAEWLPEVLGDFAERIDGPVASGLEFGHAFPSACLPVGTAARLEAAQEGVRLLV
jgi:muramoyltetrapeptide carboxypeptidase